MKIVSYFKRNRVLVSWVLLGLGLAATAASVAINQAFIQKFLEAMGTSLIATGLINWLEYFLNEKKASRHPQLLYLQRTGVDPAIHKKKYKASEVDLLGVSLKEGLVELANSDEFATRLINEQLTVRIIIVHPNSPFLKQRYLEDHSGTFADLQERQYLGVENCVRLFWRLQKAYDKAIKKDPMMTPKGRLEIRLINANPYITLARYDNEIYWGLYTSDREGIKSPFFFTANHPDSSDEDSSPIDVNQNLFSHLGKHFDGLMTNPYTSVDSSSDRARLVEFSSICKPKLDEDVVREILPESRYKELFTFHNG